MKCENLFLYFCLSLAKLKVFYSPFLGLSLYVLTFIRFNNKVILPLIGKQLYCLDVFGTSKGLGHEKHRNYGTTLAKYRSRVLTCSRVIAGLDRLLVPCKGGDDLLFICFEQVAQLVPC